jgi:TIR domain
MAHDVFISHSTRDKPVSDAVCAALENAGIRCWVAPRDVQPGRSFAGEITRAIQQSKAMVLIFSANSNTSEQVLREVQLAVDSQLHILQFRIEEVLLNDDLKYYLSTPHWLDALTPPLENHLGRLSTSIKALLGKPEAEAAVSVVAPTADRTSHSVVAPIVPERAPPFVSNGASPKSPPRNLRMPALIVAVLLCGIVLGVILFRQSERPKSEARPQPSATPTATVVEVPASSPVDGAQISQLYPIPSTKRTKLFSHNFETAVPVIKPLFGSNIMTALNANGEGQITGKSAGILPAMFDKLLLDDFILECGMRAETLPPGARYGFIFRAADVQNGGIAKYYALLLDPNKNIAQMNWWMDGRWMMNPEQPVPPGLLKVGRKSRITLEAVGNRFRVFINDRFGAEFSMDGLNDGRIGLCLLGVDAKPWTVHFDNFDIYLPPEKEPANAAVTTTSSAPTTAAPRPFQRSWDFSAGMLHDVRTEGVELVDASMWKMTGGKHLRFLTGGRSFLEATFDVPDGAEAPTRLTVRHLSSSPDGKQPGFSPVRITLNGGEIFRASPAKSGWTDDEIELGHYVQPGMNTLLFEYLDGAQTHYWLKSFRVSSGKQ